MIICESTLLTILITLLVVSTRTDCTVGIIQNRHLIISVVCALPVDFIYYIVFASDYLPTFFANYLLLVVTAILLYAYHLWSAGDSKLLMAAGLCLPGRFYTIWESTMTSAFTIVIIVFSCAFLYVIGESVVIGLKSKTLFSFRTGRFDVRRSIVSYFAMVGSLMLLNHALSFLFPALASHPAMFSAINFLLVLSLIQLRNYLRTLHLTVATILIWMIILLLPIFKPSIQSLRFDYRSWLLVLAIMLLRMMAEQYNYQTVPTAEVKAGQILSRATIMAFSTSRVKGLPVGMTEDLRSRITVEEADSVHRWEKSAHGKPWIVIVRKIPFAVFIAVGFLAYLLMEVIMQ